MTQVKEIMRHDKFVIAPTDTLTRAAEKMKEHEIGVVIVADGERLVGMLTDRDIVVRGLAKGRDPNTTKAEEVMSSPVIHCIEDDSTDGIARRMAAERVSRLPVLDHHLKLRGLVSVRDLCVFDNAKGGEVIAKMRVDK
ncbi:MAG TPA: CBS domain-containing protein [Alphaproteobacteria bacterium]|nr:CBS domain-containing protein [Alphaproteobacteria bacterium]